MRFWELVVVMDTPERSQIGSTIARFEDSPVFNFINSLSPIKPVKSTHITQTLNSLSFASIPSVFTSPHVISDKDPRFLRRHQLSDPSKAETSCKDGNKICKNAEVVEADMMSNNAASVEPLNEMLKPSYNCGSPECNRTPYCAIESNSVLAIEDMSTSLVPYHQGVSETGLFEGEGNILRICQIEQKEEGAGCDWQSLISDATELMIFASPNETETFEDLMHNSHDQRGMISCSNVSQFQEDGCNDLYKAQLTRPVDPGEQYKTHGHSTHPEEALKLKVDQPLGEYASTSMRGTSSQLSIEMDNETVSNLHRGMRRRCLIFEMGGAAKMNVNSTSSYSSLVLSQSDESIDKQLVPFKHNGDSSRHILPGIGLHLNTLALTPKDDPKVVKHEALVTGQSYTTDSAVFRSPSTGEESFDKLLIASFEREIQPRVDDIPASEDASQLSAEVGCEDFNQSSPKKKRRRSDNTGENDSCKRCNCKKSKCLKLYCECFAAGVYCIEPCSCQECHNKPIHEDTVLATRKQIETRNPLAFAPKVIRSADSIIPDIRDESNQTPASARHKRGCNCKKSNCLKKYCECYQGGVGCSTNCRCESCKNAFGRKDGSSLLDIEAEPDEEENDKFEKNMVDNGMQKPQIQISEAQNADSTTPATPLHLCRLPVQLPISSKSKMQRSFTIGSSSGLKSFPTHSKSTFLRPCPKPEKNVKTNSQENELPEILRSKSTPIRGIKSSSPNSKRVSPPHCNFGSSSSSPGRRSSRKLILQSIPSFPSLTHQP